MANTGISWINAMVERITGDVDAILSSSSDLIEEHGLSLSEVREVVISDMLNDQQLPVDRSLHPLP